MPSVGNHTKRLCVGYLTTNMLGRKIKGISTPGTLDQRNTKHRKVEKQRISALEAKVELLLNEADAMQDLNETL